MTCWPELEMYPHVNHEVIGTAAATCGRFLSLFCTPDCKPVSEYIIVFYFSFSYRYERVVYIRCDHPSVGLNLRGAIWP